MGWLQFLVVGFLAAKIAIAFALDGQMMPIRFFDATRSTIHATLVLIILFLGGFFN